MDHSLTAIFINRIFLGAVSEMKMFLHLHDFLNHLCSSAFKISKEADAVILMSSKTYQNLLSYYWIKQKAWCFGVNSLEECTMSWKLVYTSLCGEIKHTITWGFYLWVLHPVAHLSNWFFTTPSIATKFQYINFSSYLTRNIVLSLPGSLWCRQSQRIHCRKNSP
jgi:hypothetical protein